MIWWQPLQTRTINSPDFSSRFVYESEFKAIAENNALHDPLFMKSSDTRCALAIALMLRCIGVQPPEAYPQTLFVEHVITLRFFYPYAAAYRRCAEPPFYQCQQVKQQTTVKKGFTSLTQNKIHLMLAARQGLRCIGVQPPEAYPQTLSIEHVITLRIF